MSNPEIVMEYKGPCVNFERLPEIVQMYIRSLSHSKGSQATNGSILSEFFEVVKKDPRDVTIHDWDHYAAYLNEKVSPRTHELISTSTKGTYHACIRSFFEFATPRFMRSNIPFVNPIPVRKYAGLTKTFPRRPADKREDKLLTREQMDQILKASRKYGYDKYMMLLLKKHVGLRNGEDVSIALEDVHLDEGWFGTCLEDGARKSNKEGRDPLPYFLPAFLIDELRVYIMQLKMQHPDSKWLFPGYRGTHYKRETFVKLVKQIRADTGIRFKGHWFRHTLNTYRKYEMHCPREIRKQLINHKSNESIDVYDVGAMEMRRKDFETYHPYSDL